MKIIAAKTRQQPENLRFYTRNANWYLVGIVF